MPSTIQDMIGTGVRALLMLWLPLLVKAGFITQEQQESWIAYLVGAAIALIWGIWQKVVKNRQMNTAMATPHSLTFNQLKEKMKHQAAPAVLAKDATPTLNN